MQRAVHSQVCPTPDQLDIIFDYTIIMIQTLRQVLEEDSNPRQLLGSSH